MYAKVYMNYKLVAIGVVEEIVPVILFIGDKGTFFSEDPSREEYDDYISRGFLPVPAMTPKIVAGDQIYYGIQCFWTPFSLS
jgi:hypothetical protein